MTFIRSILFFIFLVLSTIIIAGFGSIFGWFLPLQKRFFISNAWSRVNLAALSLLCGLNYRVEGLENIPDNSVIILAKHQSAWETIAFLSLIPVNKAWVLKRELLNVPIFGWALRLFQPIAIDRSAGRKAVAQLIRDGKDRLESGLSVIIFPEGTRTAPGTRRRYRIGGPLLAEKSGHPVLPVAHNAGVFWRRRDIKKYPGTIDVRIGPVIETDSLSADEINEKVEEWIESTLETLPQERQVTGDR
ncbi:MAG: 1-acyl-sn-glycerol-3-phosphate acyltransferase [gamma proteobacterium endosymbiont of Lamellibrachia anaximandri]|nr:1-acyl-sn-glycerol-3-phosphate acyltransferase [gamma proteobacterium endosymbiont of Lamellibrachia anaximandri]MBL3618516.1 1-acyl-sn-glycerol-3-phosphate acyltransferase [gamma proteobacterium endosymbiont of Lamellibrachia anaximandri]